MNPKALFKLTYGLYVVGVKNGEKLGGCIVDAVMQVSLNPDMLVLCCHKGTWTRECIEQTKEFTLSVLQADADPFVIGNFGFQSSRDVDKWSRVRYKTVHELPILEQNAAYLYCKVTETKELSSHMMFFCEVVDGEDGEGKALSYSDYQDSWKPRVMEAFKAGHSLIQKEPAESAGQNTNKGEKKMAEKWVCEVCGYEYDGETPFEELPDDYVCPLCGVGKDQFQKVEE